MYAAAIPRGILRTVLGAALALAVTLPAAAEQKFVAVTQIVEHPALDACRKGVQDALAEEGFVVGRNLKWEYHSAQGNPATAARIARKFAGATPDVIVAISTLSAQAAVSAAGPIPVVFTAVTDPLGAKLVTNLAKPGGTVTGMSDLSPITKHLDLIRKITPAARRVGVPYNTSETNSVTLVRLLKAHAPGKGLEIVTAPAAMSASVQSVVQRLVGKVDVIYVPTDNTIVPAFEAVVKIGIDNRIPVYAGDTELVARGAIAALGFNYYDVGRQTGKIVVRVLKGEKPGDIAVQGVEITELHVNLDAARKMGAVIPEKVVRQARNVVQ